MSINLDFSSVEERSFEPLAEGIYNLTIIEAEQTTSQKGSEMIKVTFEEESTKTRIWENYVLQQNCLWKLKELLDVIGVDTSASIDLDPQDLIGVMVKGKVIQDTYNNGSEEKITNRIKKVVAC